MSLVTSAQFCPCGKLEVSRISTGSVRLRQELVSVSGVVELHGGSVVAHCVLGQGSEFVMRLPLMATALAPLASPTPALGTAQPPDKASTGSRVLVVDDDVDAAQSLAMLLEMTGHEVRLAYDGPSALDMMAMISPLASPTAAQ